MEILVCCSHWSVSLGGVSCAHKFSCIISERLSVKVALLQVVRCGALCLKSYMHNTKLV